jgi:hypothetical protein
MKDWPYSSFHRWVKQRVYPLDWDCKTQGIMEFGLRYHCYEMSLVGYAVLTLTRFEISDLPCHSEFLPVRAAYPTFGILEIPAYVLLSSVEVPRRFFFKTQADGCGYC